MCSLGEGCDVSLFGMVLYASTEILALLYPESRREEVKRRWQRCERVVQVREVSRGRVEVEVPALFIEEGVCGVVQDVRAVESSSSLGSVRSGVWSECSAAESSSTVVSDVVGQLREVLQIRERVGFEGSLVGEYPHSVFHRFCEHVDSVRKCPRCVRDVVVEVAVLSAVQCPWCYDGGREAWFCWSCGARCESSEDEHFRVYQCGKSRVVPMVDVEGIRS